MTHHSSLTVGTECFSLRVWSFPIRWAIQGRESQPLETYSSNDLPSWETAKNQSVLMCDLLLRLLNSFLDHYMKVRPAARWTVGRGSVQVCVEGIGCDYQDFHPAAPAGFYLEMRRCWVSEGLEGVPCCLLPEQHLRSPWPGLNNCEPSLSAPMPLPSQYQISFCSPIVSCVAAA